MIVSLASCESTYLKRTEGEVDLIEPTAFVITKRRDDERGRLFEALLLEVDGEKIPMPRQPDAYTAIHTVAAGHHSLMFMLPSGWDIIIRHWPSRCWIIEANLIAERTYYPVLFDDKKSIKLVREGPNAEQILGELVWEGENWWRNECRDLMAD